jgi:hypothetical protein
MNSKSEASAVSLFKEVQSEMTFRKVTSLGRFARVMRSCKHRDARLGCEPEIFLKLF